MRLHSNECCVTFERNNSLTSDKFVDEVIRRNRFQQIRVKWHLNGWQPCIGDKNNAKIVRCVNFDLYHAVHLRRTTHTNNRNDRMTDLCVWAFMNWNGVDDISLSPFFRNVCVCVCGRVSCQIIVYSSISPQHVLPNAKHFQKNSIYPFGKWVNFEWIQIDSICMECVVHYCLSVDGSTQIQFIEFNKFTIFSDPDKRQPTPNR